ncbi:hypothetical protein L6164_019852 [Bauhinia variegata]|uniref:Uncharacterized protein n=1 Tax=Bauhinia variegata TaxID=167791 RepID=A0ACB9MTJ4_BAUVA|nr:hypothetical protein L6164_019852 [Bauhinia variegata]
MEKQQQKETEQQKETGKPSHEGLPLETSPFVQYKDMEEYKRQGYGTEGHLEPKPGRGPGATEAPTLSGAAVSSQFQVTPAEAVGSRHSIP